MTKSAAPQVSISVFLQYVRAGRLRAIEACLNDEENTNSLLNAKGDNGRTALMVAALYGHTEMVRYLYEQGAKRQPPLDINEKDNIGQTTLMLAALYGHTKTVRYLCEQGAKRQPPLDINEKDNVGRTALMWAAVSGQTETVQYLYEQSAKRQPPLDINAKDNIGKTALMLAALYGHTKTVRYLCEQGAKSQPPLDINKKDNNGRTALMWGARFGLAEIVQYLCDLKDAQGLSAVDVSIVSQDGETALAFYENNTDMQKRLRSCGAYELSHNNDNAFQNANAHIQNVHTWYDIASAHHNLTLLQNSHAAFFTKKQADEGFAALQKYLNAKANALSKASLDEIKAWVQKGLLGKGNLALSESLKAGTNRLNKMPIPEEWFKYINPETEESISTAFQSLHADGYTMGQVLGMLWQLLHDKSFIQDVFKTHNNPEATARRIQDFEESFMQSILAAQYEYRGQGSQACAKGFTSKVLHNLFESLGGIKGIQSRSEILEAFQAKKRKTGPAILVEDLNNIMPDLTLDLLKSAYQKRNTYPALFDSLYQKLNGVQCADLFDKENPDYQKNWAWRAHILGGMKACFLSHFPKGYPRKTPHRKDFLVLEQNINPVLPYTHMKRWLIRLTEMAKQENQAAHLEHVSLISDFLNAVSSAVHTKKPLPKLPEALKVYFIDEAQEPDYNRAYENTRARRPEADFHFALLQRAVPKPKLDNSIQAQHRSFWDSLGSILWWASVVLPVYTFIIAPFIVKPIAKAWRFMFGKNAPNVPSMPVLQQAAAEAAAPDLHVARTLIHSVVGNEQPAAQNVTEGPPQAAHQVGEMKSQPSLT